MRHKNWTKKTQKEFAKTWIRLNNIEVIHKTLITNLQISHSNWFLLQPIIITLKWNWLSPNRTSKQQKIEKAHWFMGCPSVHIIYLFLWHNSQTHLQRSEISLFHHPQAFTGVCKLKIPSYLIVFLLSTKLQLKPKFCIQSDRNNWVKPCNCLDNSLKQLGIPNINFQ